MRGRGLKKTEFKIQTHQKINFTNPFLFFMRGGAVFGYIFLYYFGDMAEWYYF